MKIRKKIILIVAVLVIFVCSCLIFLFRFSLSGGFLRIEERIAKKSFLQAKIILEKKVLEIDSSVKDWANWDDTYNYILGKNKNYIKENIYPEILENLDINFIGFLNDKKEIIYVYGIDSETKKEKNYYNLLKLIISERILKDETMGIVAIENKIPIIIALRPILKSDGSGPSVGYLIFGRFIDKDFIQETKEITSFPLFIDSLNNNSQDFSNEKFIKLEENIFIERPSQDKIYTYGLITDIYGKNSVFVRVENERFIYQEGIFLIKNTISILIIGALLASFSFLWIINRSILRRIELLGQSIKKFSSTAEPSYFFGFGSNDEIDELAKQVKKSLSESSWIQEQIKKGEANYRRIFELSPEAIVVLNNKGKFLDVNGRIYDWLGYKKEELLGKNLLRSPLLGRKEKIEAIKKLAQRLAGKEIPPYDLEFICKDGTKKIGEVRGKPIKNEKGKIIGDLVMITDVTEIRKKEEDILRISQAIEDSSDAIGISNSKGEHFYHNKSFKKLFGYTVKDLNKIGGPKKLYLDKTIANEVFKKIIQGKSWIGEVDMQNKKGEKIRIFLRASVIKNKEGKTIGLLGIHTNITKDFQIREKLRQSEERYRDLFENINDLVQSVDKNGKFIYTNKAWQEKLGYSKEDLKKITLFDIIQEDHLPYCKKLFKKILKGEKIFNIETVFLTKKGKEIIVEGNISPKVEDGKFISTRGIFRDITERKKYENETIQSKKEIEKENKKNKAIIDNIAEGLIVIDENKRIIVFNNKAEELLGYSSKQIRWKILDEKIKLFDEMGNEITRAKRPINIVFKEKKIFTSGIRDKYYYLRKGGKEKFPVAMIISPLIFEGKIVGAIEIFRDITKEKEIDRAKTEFVSMASHQLRTPLTTINWYLEMLLDREVGDITKEQEDYLKSVYNASKTMTNLVGALLNVARIELGTFAIEPRRTNIKEIVEGTIKELLPKIEKKKIQIKKEFSRKLPFIFTDPKLTRIIFQNLISNALKYTRYQGEVSIALERKGKNVLFQVSDNGYGIPKKEQKMIFTKLFRADNIKKIEPDGTGLGLYITKGIVDGYGGKIWFKSEENKGTTFSVLIPLKIKRKTGSKKITILET